MATVTEWAGTSACKPKIPSWNPDGLEKIFHGILTVVELNGKLVRPLN